MNCCSSNYNSSCFYAVSCVDNLNVMLFLRTFFQLFLFSLNQEWWASIFLQCLRHKSWRCPTTKPEQLISYFSFVSWDLDPGLVVQKMSSSTETSLLVRRFCALSCHYLSSLVYRSYSWFSFPRAVPSKGNIIWTRRAICSKRVRGVRVPRRQHAVHARRPRGGVPAPPVRRRRPVHRARGVLQVLSRWGSKV